MLFYIPCDAASMGDGMSSVFLASDQFCDMGFNGPMRSGLVLDSRSLLVKGYTDYQVQLQKTLKGLFSGDSLPIVNEDVQAQLVTLSKTGLKRV